MSHDPKHAWCWGSEPPVYSIGYDDELLGDFDSGFTVLFDDAPAPEEVESPDDDRLEWVCMHCLLEDFPEIGRGLDLALEHGAADLDENGEWQGRTLEDPA